MSLLAFSTSFPSPEPSPADPDGQHEHVPREEDPAGAGGVGESRAGHPLQLAPPHRVHASRAVRLPLERYVSSVVILSSAFIVCLSGARHNTIKLNYSTLDSKRLIKICYWNPSFWKFLPW